MNVNILFRTKDFGGDKLNLAMPRFACSRIGVLGRKVSMRELPGIEDYGMAANSTVYGYSDWERSIDFTRVSV